MPLFPSLSARTLGSMLRYSRPEVDPPDLNAPDGGLDFLDNASQADLQTPAPYDPLAEIDRLIGRPRAAAAEPEDHATAPINRPASVKTPRLTAAAAPPPVTRRNPLAEIDALLAASPPAEQPTVLTSDKPSTSQDTRLRLPAKDTNLPNETPVRQGEVTKLSPAQEQRFQTWLKASGIRDADAPGSYYDYRGLFLESKGQPIDNTPGRHFSDRFKQHGHPTFSEESKYSAGPGDGGTWVGDRFVPAPQPSGTDAHGIPTLLPNVSVDGKPAAVPGITTPSTLGGLLRPSYGQMADRLRAPASAAVPSEPLSRGFESEYVPPPSAGGGAGSPQDVAAAVERMQATRPLPPDPRQMPFMDPETGRVDTAVPARMRTSVPDPVGDAIVGAVTTTPIEGADQIATGLEKLSKLGINVTKDGVPVPKTLKGRLYAAAPHVPSDETMNAVSDVIEGGFKAATPLFVPAAISNPLVTGAILVASVGAQKGAEAGAEALGASVPQARFVGNLAGLIAGYGADVATKGPGSGAATRTAAAADAAARAHAADVLGIEPHADQTTVRKAYLDLAKANHPDVNPTADPTAMADINLAYEWLKDHPSSTPVAGTATPAKPKQTFTEWAKSQVDWLKSKLQDDDGVRQENQPGANITTEGRALPGDVAAPPEPPTAEHAPVTPPEPPPAVPPELGPDAIAGPEKPVAPPAERKADWTDADEAAYQAQKAERARMAEGFKQTSVAAQDNAAARKDPLAAIDAVLGETATPSKTEAAPATAEKPASAMSDEELAAAIAEDLKAQGHTVGKEEPAVPPTPVGRKDPLAEIDKALGREPTAAARRADVKAKDAAIKAKGYTPEARGETAPVAGTVRVVMPGEKRGAKPRTLDVKATRVGPFGVHQEINEAGTGVDPKGKWTVTHAGTGFKALDAKTEDQALWMAATLAGEHSAAWEAMKTPSDVKSLPPDVRSLAVNLARDGDAIYARAMKRADKGLFTPPDGWSMTRPAVEAAKAPLHGFGTPGTTMKPGQMSAAPATDGWHASVVDGLGRSWYSDKAYPNADGAFVAGYEFVNQTKSPLMDSGNHKTLEHGTKAWVKQYTEGFARAQKMAAVAAPKEESHAVQEQSAGEGRVRGVSRIVDEAEGAGVRRGDGSGEPAGAREKEGQAEAPREEPRALPASEKGSVEAFYRGDLVDLPVAAVAKALGVGEGVIRRAAADVRTKVKPDALKDLVYHHGGEGVLKDAIASHMPPGLEAERKTHVPPGIDYPQMTEAELRELVKTGTHDQHMAARDELARRNTSETAAGATVTKNAERSSVEVKFAQKPAPAVIDALKSAGFRWAKTNRLWYKKAAPSQIDALHAKAQRIVGHDKAMEQLADWLSQQDAEETKQTKEPKAEEPTAEEPKAQQQAEEPKSENGETRDQKRKRLREERKKLIDDVYKRLSSKLQMNIDPGDILAVVKLLRNYAEDGLNEFADAAEQFLEDLGPKFKEQIRGVAARAFEFGWKRLHDEARSIDEAFQPKAAAEQFAKQWKADRADLLDRYLNEFGNVVSADNAKELSPAFKYATTEERGAIGDAIHPTSSAIAHAAYTDLISTRLGPGQRPLVTFVVGGPGAGKTTALNSLPALKSEASHSRAVFDGAFSNADNAAMRIQMALDAGNGVNVIYVHRDPAASWQGTLERAKAEGRRIPMDYHVKAHVLGLPIMDNLTARFAKTPDVHINYVADGAVVTRDDLPEAYNADDVRAAITEGRTSVAAGDEGVRRPVRGAAGAKPQAGDAEDADTAEVGAADGERDLSGRRPAGAGDTGTPAGGPGDRGAAGVEAGPAGREGAPAEPVSGGKRRPPSRVRRPAAGGEAPVAGTPEPRGGGVHETGDVGTAGVSDDVTVATARGQTPLHFQISDAADLTEGGWTTKLDANLAALKLLKALQADGRKATADEQQILAKYIGWGHTNLAPVVHPDADTTLARDPRVQQARQELEQILTKAEMQALGESTVNAHYSFNDLPRAMWDAVQKLGFKGGTILEPAVGTGHFFGTMPGEIVADKRTRLFGVDKEPIAAAIAAQLYQGAHIQASPLEEAALPNNYFDLAISNVPFGKIEVFDPDFVSGDKERMTRSIHNYYFAKALETVRPGGLVAFITSRFTMDAQNDGVRRYLAQRAKLLGALRLPDASFRKTAGTDVVTDVLLLQKYTPEEAKAAKAEFDYARDYDNASAKDRKEMRKPTLPEWVESRPKTVKGKYEGTKESFHVNEYFHANRKNILGEENSAGKMARTNEPQYNVAGEVKLPQLQKAVERLNLSPDAYKPSTSAPRKIALSKPPDGKQGSFVLEKGKLYLYDKGTLVPSDLKGKALDRATAFIPLRDTYQTVLDTMTAQGSDADLTKAQQAMKRAYDAFVKVHGHVSARENARVIELDPNGSRVLALEETEIEKQKVGNRTVTVVKVTGLAPIFTKRTVRPVVEPTSAASPHDALVQSLAWKGQVDVPYMATLLGKPESEVLAGLKGEVFRDPQTQAWVPKDDYLSGDVVTKLAQADAAAKSDDAYTENVEALKSVQPVQLGADEFEAPLGATWVPTDLYQQFLREEGRAPGITVRLVNNEHRTTFYVDGYGGVHQFMPAGEEFKDWAANALNGRLPVLKTKSPDGKSEVTDPKATEEYRQSLAQLREAWQTWWRLKNEVADQVSSIYNAMFNREAPRAFDGEHLVIPNASPDVQLRPWQKNVVWRALQSGNTLLAHAVGAGKTYAMIGIAGEMKRLGLAQKPMIVVPNHLVEQWRRDVLRMYPDARVLIPTERDFEKANRQRLISRIANNDWDSIILAQTQFLRVAVKTETLKAFVDEQVQQLIADGAEQLGMSADEFEQTVEDYDKGDKRAKQTIAGRGVPRSVKDIARMVLNLKARLKKRLDQQKKDAPVVFEQTGVDALLVDEAHLFKNLFFSTSRNNIAGLRGSDAQRSQDMFLKIRLINQQSNGRNVHFATGTPISNAMSEMYTMFRYLAQPTLDRLGMAGFDSWANAYAVARGEMEPTAEGGYKERIRLRDWSNLRELSKLFRRFADVILPEDLVRSGVLKLPALKHGRPTTIAIEPHPDMANFMATIAARAEALKTGKVDPKDDNYLKLSTEASLAAIDMRLVNPGASDYPGSRLRMAADEIAKRYHEHAGTLGTQLAFLDVGTPKGAALEGLPGAKTAAPKAPIEEAEDTGADDADGDLVDAEKEAEDAMDYIRSLGTDRDLYSELKRLLVAKGVPADEIAFIHQAKEPADQGKLFQMVREGRVRVMLASTAKGGVGMNIQDRLVALHHLDVPWRPADMEQREGRIIRQGNQNPEVEVLRYVTKKSFDEYRWGLLATKQGFIHQFMRGELTTMDDADPAQMDMQVAQALASGDPRVLKMLNLEREVKGLRARYTNYERKRGSLRQEKGWAESSIRYNTGRIEKLTPMLEQGREWEKAPTVTLTAALPSYRSDGFLARAGGHHGTPKPRTFDWSDKDARKAFNDAAAELLAASKYENGLEIGHAGPFRIVLNRVTVHEKVEGDQLVKAEANALTVQLPVKNDRGEPVVMGTTRAWDPEKPPDLRRGLDSLMDVSDIARWVGEAKASIAKQQKAIADFDATLDKPFPQVDALKEKEAELHQLKLDVSGAKIDAAAKADETAPAEGADAIKAENPLGGGSGGNAMAAGAGSGLFTPPPAPPRAQRPSGAAGAPPPTGPLPEAAGLTQGRKGPDILGIPNAIRALIHPEGLGADARGTAGTIRHEGAEAFRQLAIADARVRAFSEQVDALPRDKAVDYWDAAENGRSTRDPEMDAGNAELRRITDHFTKQLVALDRLKADAVREHYIGRFWSVEPDNIPDFLKRALGRRPLEGPKSFLKQRTWENFADGIRAIQAAQARVKAGIPRQGDERISKMRPATYNWVESQLAKIAEMQRVIAAEKMLRYEEQAGRAKKVLDSLGKKPPQDVNGEDWVNLSDGKDPAFIVYGPKKVAIKEMYDAKLMEGLHNFARSLGVLHVRKIAVGGNRWGYAVGKSAITTKVGGPEGVLMHEIGHILDERYGLRQQWVNDPDMKKELRALADMREEGTNPKNITDSRRRYLRKGEEKIANAVHAFIYMPERMKKVAPHTYWAIHNLAKSTPELKPLLDIQKQGRSLKLDVNVAEQEIPGFPVVGHWYAPKASAAVWRNHLSKGFASNPMVGAFNTVGNASTQILLGMSGFHFTTIATEGMFSRIALSIDALANRGRHVALGEAARHAISALPAAGVDAVIGRRIMQEYRNPGTHPEYAKVLDAMIKGGYRGTAENEFWTGDRLEKLKETFQKELEAIAQRNGGAALWHGVKLPLNALWAGIDLTMKPLMGKYVPWMKTAATYRAVATMMSKLPPDASIDRIREASWNIVKEMDLRYGQVVYDNHFIDRAIKDAAQTMFLAPGWTFGTLALAGRGIGQAASIPVRAYKIATGKDDGAVPNELIGPSAAYWYGAVLGTMLICGVLTYLLTGEHPEGKDYFGFRDGSTDDDGNPNRHLMPGYLMKDIYGWRHHPVDTAGNKLKSVWAFLYRFVVNRDYFGDMIRNPDDTGLVQAKQVGKAAVKEMATPLSVQNLLEAKHRGNVTAGEVVRNAFGITPAKREFERTPAQNMAANYLQRRGKMARTPEQVETADERRQMRDALRRGEADKAATIAQSGELSRQQMSTARKAVKETFLQYAFKELTLDEALHVYDAATPAERAQIRGRLLAKSHLITEAPPAARAALRARWRAAVGLPSGVH